MQRSACSLLKKQKYKNSMVCQMLLPIFGAEMSLYSWPKMRIDDTIDNILDAYKK